MSGGAVFGTGGKATQFVVLIEGTYALLPNEDRLVVGIAATAAAGPVSTVQLGRTSVRPTAVDPPTTSGRAGGRGRRRPRRRGRSRCGVPFKIVGGHVCLFCFYVCVAFVPAAIPTKSNVNQQKMPMGALMGLVQVNLFSLFLGAVFNENCLHYYLCGVRWLGRATKVAERESRFSRESVCLE